MLDLNLLDLSDIADDDQLQNWEEGKQGLNKAGVHQGDPSFEKEPSLNQTVRYLGGIRLSLDGLNDEIIKQGAVVTNTYNGHSADYVVFRELEVVVLQTSRNRRHYMEVDGQRKLACGTNQSGPNARGWSGVSCKACPWHKDNIEQHGYDKKDACKSLTNQLIYIPSLDHVAIMEIAGTSYLAACDWMEQLSKLSRAYAQTKELQAAAPGLKRVSPWMFKTTLTTGPFQKQGENAVQMLAFTKAAQPYDWISLLNTPEVIQKAKAHWAELKEMWETMFVGHNPNAVMSLPSVEAVAAIAQGNTAALPANSSAAQPALVSTVVVPEVPQNAQPVAQPAPAQPAVAQQPAQQQQVPGVTVSQIAIPEEDDAGASLPPVNVPMGF